MREAAGPAMAARTPRPAMAARILLTTAALLGAGSIFSVAGHAQDEILPWSEPPTFACAAGTAGQLSVQANVQCACRFFPVSEMRGTPAGYRWDCGILRARTNHEVPESAAPYPYPLPPALSVDSGFFLEDRDPHRRFR